MESRSNIRGRTVYFAFMYEILRARIFEYFELETSNEIPYSEVTVFAEFFHCKHFDAMYNLLLQLNY